MHVIVSMRLAPLMAAGAHRGRGLPFGGFARQPECAQPGGIGQEREPFGLVFAHRLRLIPLALRLRCGGRRHLPDCV
jgi:hypothetical protein